MKVTPSVFAALCILSAGYGGGGAGVSSDSSGGSRPGPTLPSTPTTYVGQLKDPNGIVLGTLTTVIQPTGTYTMSLPANGSVPGLSISGNILIPEPAQQAGLSFTLTPSENGNILGMNVSSSATYQGGGFMSSPTTQTISGDFGFNGGGHASQNATFTGTS